MCSRNRSCVYPLVRVLVRVLRGVCVQLAIMVGTFISNSYLLSTPIVESLCPMVRGFAELQLEAQYNNRSELSAAAAVAHSRLSIFDTDYVDWFLITNADERAGAAQLNVTKPTIDWVYRQAAATAASV